VTVYPAISTVSRLIIMNCQSSISSELVGGGTEHAWRADLDTEAPRIACPSPRIGTMDLL